MTTTDDDLDATDCDALARAMKICGDEVRHMDGSWRDRAERAASIAQTRAMHLGPHERPPCDAYWQVATPGGWKTVSDPKAAEIYHSLLDLGFSIYEPDPMTALRKRK